MKLILAVLMLVLCLHANAHSGHSIAGIVSLSGGLKSLAYKGSIPLGSVNSYYGYEALNYPTNTPVYCYGGLGFSTNGGLVGLSLGGSVSKVSTVGACNKPEDYLGGFLGIGLNYQIGSQGTQVTNVEMSINLDFRLAAFNNKLVEGFYSPTKNQLVFKSKIKRSVLHLVQYAGRSKSNAGDLLMLKLITLPLTAVSGMQVGIKGFNFSKSDLRRLKDKNTVLGIKTELTRLYDEMKQDPDFYQCPEGECHDVYAETLYLMEAIVASMGTCHSVTATANFGYTYDVSIPIINPSLGYSLSYSMYAPNSLLKAKADTKVAVVKTLATLPFKSRSKSCDKVHDMASNSLLKFLSIMKAGKF